MTTIADYKAAERALAMQYRAFEEMKQNPELKKALELDAALEEFCTANKTTRAALYELLALDIAPVKKTAASNAKPAASKPSGARKMQVYKVRWFRNPHTGEELEVRGNRDGRFNAWNIEYGKDVVASWKFREEDLPPKSARI